MKIECVKEKLGLALAKADRITGKKLTLPILSCILLEAKNNTLFIRATNLDLGIELSIPVKVEKEGVVVIPNSVLTRFISSTQGEKNIKIEALEGVISVSTGSSKASIKTFAKEDFPTIPQVSDTKTIKIESRDIVLGLRSVWYSASTSSMKPELSSIFVYSDNNELIFVATDSFRLAEKKVSTKKKIDIAPILIPFKNSIDIIKVLEEESGEITIVSTKNQISFMSQGMYLVSRVVDGAFPDYKQIVPKEFTTEVVVLKQDLLNIFKISTIFSDTFNQINIKALPKEKKIQIQTKNSEVGENSNNLDAALNGEDVDINFNYKYINDCFQSITTDSVSLAFNGPTKPLVIRGVGDRTFMYLVMPMNR
ncbi:MAG: DNA polymerase III subunit beta [Candidatus Paceibacterota bacterium]|jgi:DNA polymerase-3 subunit beta